MHEQLTLKGLVNNLRNGLKIMRRRELMNGFKSSGRRFQLFLFMTVFSQTFFAFVGRHFMSLSFLTAWHNLFCFWLITVS